jgi:hypothetical protein
MNARTILGCLLVAVTGLVLLGCPFTPGGSTDLTSFPEVQHVPYTGTFTYTVDPGSATKDVYFVFTNTSLDTDASAKPTVSSQSISVDGVKLPGPAAVRLPSKDSTPSTLLARLAEIQRDPFGAVGTTAAASRRADAFPAKGSPSYDTTGQAGSLYDMGLNDATISVAAHCRYVSPAVTVADGSTRTLNIWVADDCWIDTGTEGTGTGQKRHLVTQTMVDTLASKFLKTGLDNDIYDWDTNVLGAEWGTTGYSNLIAPNDEITILLSDIEEDNSDNGGVVGYYDPTNNFTTSSYSTSNERIMFVVDAVMFATPDATTWAATDYWAEFVYSTLAHEFQHMIQFYQKAVVAGAGTDADSWINEMCSMIMEDLVADKLGINGPRGVVGTDGTAGASGNTDGRIPYYNEASFYPLAVTSGFYNDVTNYSTSYAFGAWLARNYGGAELLTRIVQSVQTDSTAVVESAATASGRTESMERLLEKWAVAILLSDTTSAPAGYVLNTGDFMTSTADGASYNLGSIDFFNYDPGLLVYSPTSTIDYRPYYSSNVFYKAATGLSAAKTFTVTLPANVVMSVVLK